jgi:hypothetical protein
MQFFKVFQLSKITKILFHRDYAFVLTLLEKILLALIDHGFIFS